MNGGETIIAGRKSVIIVVTIGHSNNIGTVETGGIIGGYIDIFRIITSCDNKELSGFRCSLNHGFKGEISRVSSPGIICQMGSVINGILQSRNSISVSTTPIGSKHFECHEFYIPVHPCDANAIITNGTDGTRTVCSVAFLIHGITTAHAAEAVDPGSSVNISKGR